jgi:DNA-directed RNA polymerase beta' subunit
MRLSSEARLKAIVDLCKNVKRCGKVTEDGCGALQPNYVKDKEALCRLKAEWKDLADDTTPAIEDGEEEGEGSGGAAAKKSQPDRVLDVETVHRIISHVTDDDVEFLGFSRYWSRPEWMICTMLQIPPPQVRPSVMQDNNQRSEDDITHKLIEIYKTNSELADKIAKGSDPTLIESLTDRLQYHVATLVDNEIPGVAQSAQRSGRPLKSFKQRIGSKEGRIRNNLEGKRVEYSARSVISPDPSISVGELVVPMKVAMDLTFPVHVTRYNIQVLYRLVQNGPRNYPGATSIIRASDGAEISLERINTKEVVLYEGDVVRRHMIDGDRVLFNRQPSLHKMSMQCHRAVVLPYETFRLNPMVCTPYNADFDGDKSSCHQQADADMVGAFITVW